MVGYLAITLLILLTFKLTWNDRIKTETTYLCQTNVFASGCGQGADTPSFVRDINDNYFFSFVKYGSRDCGLYCKDGYDLYRYNYVDNYYPFVIVLLMTVIRWIFTGKHIWQRPETG